MVVLRVPATTANLGPGFDTLGMALNMYNYIAMVETGNDLVIEVEGDGAEKVPRNTSNLAYKAASRVFQRISYKSKGLRIKIENNIPMARGLGSSASVIVGGMVAANYITGSRLSYDQLLHMATCMEGHPDNVAPALLGGIVISAQFDEEIIYRRIQPPADLTTVVAIPDYELSTREARNALPAKVPMDDAVYNMSRTSLLVWAFMNSDMELMGKAMEDKLHQPYRMSLIPGMDKVVQAARNMGAYSVALSGAGPTIIAFCTSNNAETIGKTMKRTFKEAGIQCSIKNLTPEINGVKIIKEKGVQLWA